METILKTFEPNELGRDFAIGDLHGSLPCFDRLLKGLEFDPTKDRMFSVGDLVDRGPDSLGCLRLLWNDWFHSTKSNHEQMMYEAFNGGHMGQFWFMNGGTWGMETWNLSKALLAKKTGAVTTHLPIVSDDDMELLDLLIKVDELPFLITIKNKNGKTFHLIHAELPPGYIVTDKILSSPGKVHELATVQAPDGDTFLWGRYKFMALFKADLGNRDKIIRTLNNSGMLSQFNDELSHIISGHTIMQQAVTLVGQTNIDTGAFYSCAEAGPNGFTKVPKWAGLTCVCLDDWKFYKATPSEFNQVRPFVINKTDLI